MQPAPPPVDTRSFLTGEGVMARLIRQKDWSQTSLGPPDTWPQSLRTTLNIMLAAHFPMYVAWGPDFIQLYNDAYQPILGTDKHPAALGGSSRDTFPEIWDWLGPKFEACLRGEAFGADDLLIPLDRNGYLEECYFTFSYTPIRDETGGFGGLIVPVSETSERVIRERREHSLRQLAEGLTFANNPDEINRLLEQIQRYNPLDLPVVGFYPADASGQFSAEADWPLADVVQAGQPLRFNPRSNGSLPVQELYALPVGRAKANELPGVLVLGVNARQRFEGGQQTFLEAVADLVDKAFVKVWTAQQERYRMETHQQAEAYLQGIVAQAPFAICILRGADFTVEMANEQQFAIWGRPAEHVLNRPLFEAISEAGQQRFDTLLTKVLTTGETVTFSEVRSTLPTPDGRTRTGYFDCTYQALRNSTGGVNRIMSVTNEVTDRVLARQLIEDNTNRLQTLLEQAPVGVAILGPGPEFVFELANPFYVELCGRPADQIVGKPLLEALPELAGQGFDELLMQVMATGESYVSREAPVNLIRNGQPETIYIDFVYQPRRNDGPRNAGPRNAGPRDADVLSTSGVVVVVTDVTQAVRARQLVEETGRQFKQLTDLVPQILWTAQPDGSLDYYNRTWYEYTGFIEGYGDQSWVPILHPDDVQVCLDTWYHSVQTGEPYQIEYRFIDRRHPGTYRWFIGRATPVRDETTDGQPGAITKWFGTCTDIHDQKIAAERLEKVVAERTESLHRANVDLERSNLDLIQFASVASHDLKEPLRKVQTFGTLLEEKLTGRLNAEEANMLQRLINSTARMQTLVGDVLRLSKLSDPTVSFGPVDLNAVIDQIRDDLELTIQERHAELIIDSLPTVLAAMGQMHQLFLNLISNALKFNDSPQPIIRIEPVLLADDIMEELRLPSRNYAVIAVTDNGIGFEEKYRDKIFGMFQRLHVRSQYAGTGIGLTIVKKIIENHRGYIDVQSEPGRGTTFRIALPLS